jgi:hypothetical protein
MNWFRSRYTMYLESQIEKLTQLSAEVFEKQETRHQAEIARLEKARGEQLLYVIEDNQKLRDDLDRIRLLLTPALQSVELAKERTEPPKPTEDTFLGTPWQRTQQQWAWKLRKEREEAERQKKAAANIPAPAVKGDEDGSTRSGRNEAPLGE